MSNTLDNSAYAFNALRFTEAFKIEFEKANAQREAAGKVKVRPTLDHIETFFFLCTADMDGVELKHLQKQLDYMQAKMHRTIDTLIDQGWVEQREVPNDARRRTVHLTDAGRAFYEEMSENFSSNSGNNKYWENQSAAMAEAIRAETSQKEAVKSDTPTYDKELWSMVMKNVIKEKLGWDVEIGANYIKGEDGAVTFPVLLKKTVARNMNELAQFFMLMGEAEMRDVLAPSRVRMFHYKDPEAALATLIEKHGMDEIKSEKVLNLKYHSMLAQIQGKTLHTMAVDSPAERRNKRIDFLRQQLEEIRTAKDNDEAVSILTDRRDIMEDMLQRRLDRLVHDVDRSRPEVENATMKIKSGIKDGKFNMSREYLDKHGQLITDKDLRRWLDRKYTNVRKGIGSLSGISKGMTFEEAKEAATGTRIKGIKKRTIKGIGYDKEGRYVGKLSSGAVFDSKDADE